MTNENIIVQGARTNNLKNISVAIPKRKITVITGVSGAGKSSLALGTIAAASQRQVNKTYSAYVQQLLPQFPEPDVTRIKNLPFTLVVDQKGIGNNRRSTLGTYTDIYSALRLLFSRIAQPFIGYSMNYSFNNPAGMCPHCEGLGQIRAIDPNKLLNFDKSLNEGAIEFPTFQPGGWRLSRYTESGFFDNNLALKKWPSPKLELLLYGKRQTPPRPTANWHKSAFYLGLIPRIQQTFLNKSQAKYQQELQQIVKISVCPVCHGQRLKPQALEALINNQNIADCSAMSLVDLQQWLCAINNSSVQPIIEELTNKLNNLITAGLGYLSLDRTTASLSGGEAQRVKLANYLNSGLTDLLYIFDEPSVGLHAYDLLKVIKIFQRLKAQGNTVLIDDHDPQIIAIADHVINLGEPAGTQGGYITFSGSYADLKKSATLTGTSLRHLGDLKSTYRLITNFYQINNVTQNNLQHVQVKIPQRSLTAITGVAGSGKSSLISAFKSQYPQTAVLNQHLISGSNRSNVLTYLNIFDSLRQYFAQHTHRALGLFSFNSQGACPICKGKGVLKLDLAYMGNSVSICEACHGQRYAPTVLKLRVQGMNIAEAMDLNPQSFAEKFPILQSAMRILQQVGLGYIQLNQALDTFSGGELQRLKLAHFLLKQTSDILVLDEPTSGLHEYNVQKLITLLHKLIQKYPLTIIVIEHNLRLMGQADWIVDLGPYAGAHGGKILFSGRPRELYNQGQTLTAQALRRYWK